MNEKRKSLDMTQGEPAKLLILFAIPMLIGGIFQLMYNMVDTIVVGRFVSIDALAAIGATSSTTMFIMFLGQSGPVDKVSIFLQCGCFVRKKDNKKDARMASTHVSNHSFQVYGNGGQETVVFRRLQTSSL